MRQTAAISYERHVSVDAAEAKKEARRRIEEARRSGARVLRLTGLGLRTLPSEIGELTSLISLWLSNNELEQLPDEIAQLSLLRDLVLDRNKLTQLPADIGALSNLEILFAERNEIRALPRELARLKHLTGLFLEGNPLQDPLPALLDSGIPDLFAYLRSLDDAAPQLSLIHI